MLERKTYRIYDSGSLKFCFNSKLSLKIFWNDYCINYEKNQIVKKKLLNLFVIILFFMFSNLLFAQNQPNWTAPQKYKTMKMIKNDANDGKVLYAKYCKSCHGSKGLGDGVKSNSLATFPSNFTNSKFQSKTDGELYYISIIGEKEMPNFEKKIIDEQDRWSLVSFIRTFKK